MRALISVWDKTGVVDFATRLSGLGWEIVSSGGTAGALANAGVPVLAVEDVTGSPEMLGGRVKTLHPRIHGGILADRSKPAHLASLHEHGIAAIDLVVCNLYPFRSDPGPGADRHRRARDGAGRRQEPRRRRRRCRCGG